MRVDGLRAVVTGAASGIGLATARLLVEEGGRVAALDLSTPPDDLDALAVAADVTDQASRDAAAVAVRDAFGGVDIVSASTAPLLAP